MYEKRGLILSQSAVITMEAALPVCKPCRRQNHIETTELSCIYVNIWSTLQDWGGSGGFEANAGSTKYLRSCWILL